MIVFKHISFKNFLSVGEDPVEINLGSRPTTLIVGKNGNGKSILLDALSFVLFNKPHRAINKPQLINSTNEKKALVELEFEVDGQSYKIRRGIKPNLFEIWKGDKKLNEEANSRDYQKVLENDILRINHKSFNQIVVLGSSNYVPFMKLSAAARREVIEDLLDIDIFSKMNKTLKDRRGQLKDQLTNLKSDIKHIEDKIDTQERHIAKLESISEEDNKRKQKDIEEAEKAREDLEQKIKAQKAQADQMREKLAETGIDIDKVSKTLRDIDKHRGALTSKLESAQKREKFFRENDECPTCQQSIDEAYKDSIASQVGSEIASMEEKFSALKEAEKKAKESTEVYREKRKEIDQIESEISSLERSDQESANTIKRLLKEIERNQKQENTKEAKDHLSELRTKLKTLRKDLGDRQEEWDYQRVTEQLLKDDGIKTRVIRHYLPIMNKLINQYLEIFNLFALFMLDESFSEHIRSRHRDDFSYSSFSEGEKSRIDLALMFTWREIARMKNSINTNLLILDETFDSSLDMEGVDGLLSILSDMGDDTNTFIISHKTDVMDGKFGKKLLFEKVNNFTRIQEAHDILT